MASGWLSIVRFDPGWSFSYGWVNVTGGTMVVRALFARTRVVPTSSVTKIAIAPAHFLSPLPAVQLTYDESGQRRGVTMLPVFRRNRTNLAALQSACPNAVCSVPKGPPILLSLLPIAAFCSLLSPLVLGIPLSEKIGAVWMGLLLSNNLVFSLLSSGEDKH